LALAPLFDTVSSDIKDTADLATAVYGIGAFFSSRRVAALRKVKRQEKRQNGVEDAHKSLDVFFGRLCMLAMEKTLTLRKDHALYQEVDALRTFLLEDTSTKLVLRRTSIIALQGAR
jgi:hypothetical protein